MEHRFLGRTGLRISALSFGTATFGGSPVVGDTDVVQAREQVALCRDAGINLFDTADAYSDGRSEEILGAALGAHRSEVLVATKLNARTGEGPNAVGQSRHHIVEAVHASLRRLDTDWIDILQVHGVDVWTDMDASLRALDDLVRAGTVRYIGCSNYSAWHLMKALSISDHHGWERFCVTQVHYSLIAREAEQELVPLCLDQDVGMIVWSPLSGGLLSGRYRAGAPAPSDGRFTHTSDPPVDDFDRAYRIVDVQLAIAGERDASPAQVALAWLLAQPAVTAVTIGARSRGQLEDNLGCAELRLTAEEVARLDAVSDRPLAYPYWHQRKYNAERSQRNG